VTNPASPLYVTYATTRDFDGQPGAASAGDLSPEGLKFISADQSPTGEPLLAVANEVSGTTSILRIRTSAGNRIHTISEPTSYGLPKSILSYSSLTTTARRIESVPGDSNHDGTFDQLDMVQILQAGRYLTGRPATFEQGDWNQDGRFDQLDIVAVLATGSYLQAADQAAFATRDAAFGEYVDGFGR
jgi:hypothetical protein